MKMILFENLRANSFLEEEDDVPMRGILDQGKDKLSNQEPKTLNQESKDVISLFNSPRAVVETVAALVCCSC